MIGKIRTPRLGIFLNVGIGIVFIIAAVITVIIVNYSMRQQAFIEAQAKARIILDRNLATHTYFSEIMKPSIFAWSEPFRSKEYFDHKWMSSTYAIREIEKYFKSLNPSGYSFKDAAIDARSPENEADEYERAFLEKLAMDKKLESDITVRNIDGKPYLVVLRKGEVMEASCLRCHSTPQNAPKGLTDHYGPERSFNRKTGDVASAVSLRIPLSEAYASANIFSLKLSAILIGILICIFTIQHWFYRRYLLEPLNVMRDKAKEIATHEDHLGEQIPQPFGRELSELTASFNEMSVKLRHERNHLEELVDQRTEEVRKEKDFAESLIQTAQAVVLVLDTTGYIVSINPYMEEISGYRLEEVQGKDWFSTFLPERDRNSIRELFLKAVGNFQTQGNVNQIVTKDGRKIDIEWSDKTLKDEKGNVVGLLSIGQDITERKQAEEEIKQREVFLNTLLSSIPIPIFYKDRDGRYTGFNRAYENFFGTTKEKLIGKTVFDISPPELAKIYHAKDNDLLESGVEQEYESQVKNTLGVIRDVIFNKAVFTDSKGTVNGLIGAILDITERKQAEEALLKSEEKYRTILESIQEGYFEVDLTGNFTFFNDSICRILGYPQEVMMGMNNRQYTDKEHSKILYQAFNKVYSTGKPAKEFDWQIIRKDGTKRYIEVSVSLQINSSGKSIGFRGIARDITERKMMEAEILALSITDPLTGLHNRRGFLSLAEQQLKLSDRNKRGVQLYFADLDGLKRINDTLGHEEGDKALIEAAIVFKETFRTSDIVARLGGDEFAALVVDITGDNFQLLAARLQNLIDTRNNQGNRRYRLSISLGSSYYDPENPCSLDDLMACADKLMYEQKQKKKGFLL